MAEVLSMTPPNPKEFDEEEKNDTLIKEFLDAENGMHGDIHYDKVIPLLKSESGYESLLNFILLPTSDGIEGSLNSLTEEEIKRSYRAMSIFCDDHMKMPSAALPDNADSPLLGEDAILDSEKAGLVVKRILHAYSRSNNFRTHHPHLNKILLSLLAKYPSSVLSASCAGGPTVMSAKFASLLTSDLSFLVTLVLYGCCINYVGEESLQQMQQNQNMQQTSQNSTISRGLKKKFVRCLIEWNLFEQITDYITTEKIKGAYITDDLNREAACDALITIVRFINYKPSNVSPNNVQNGASYESGKNYDAPFGEDALMEILGKPAITQKLLLCASQHANESKGTVSSRALLQLLEITIGSKYANKQGIQGTPQINQQPNTDAVENQNSRLVHWGVGQSIYEILLENCQTLVQGLVMPSASFNDENKVTSSKISPVFTSQRLNVITILAEMLEFGIRTHRNVFCALLETLNSFEVDNILPVNDNKTNESKNNVWMYLNHLLYLFPENSLYQIQYYRIFLSVIRSSHEATLRLLIQKSKFVTKAIGALNGKENGNTPRGILQKCLNALRLQYKCSGPKAFLRHHLDSHSLWKSFQEWLINETFEQQLPGLGLTVPKVDSSLQISNPNEEVQSISSIDLGSPYADSMGFDGVHNFVEGELSGIEEQIEDACVVEEEIKHGKKKHKNKKKKKGKKKEVSSFNMYLKTSFIIFT